MIHPMPARPNAPPQTQHPGDSRRSRPDTAALILAALLALVILWPLAHAAIHAFGARAPLLPPGPGALRSLARSIAYALAIGVLSSLLAWPAAWAARSCSARALLALVAPACLPSYLVYAAWSTLRAPGTPLGNTLARAAGAGHEWILLSVARGLAIWGLALWAWPLACIAMIAMLRAVGPDIAAALRLDAGPTARARTIAIMTLRAPTLAAIAIAVLMLGTPVALHVAQADTYALRLWLLQTEHPGRAWRASSPLLTIAVLASLWLSARALAWSRTLPGDTPPIGASRARAHALIVLMPWLLAAVVPALLLARSLGSVDVLTRFMTRSWRSFFESLAIGACVGALCLVIGLLASAAWGAWRPRRRLLACALTLSVFAALVPGTLIGEAVLQATSARWAPFWLGHSPIPMILAHVARYAAIPVAIGMAISSGASGSTSDLRLIDGVVGARALADAFRTGAPPATALCCALLSLHEIESSVMVQPPGMHHLAQLLLNALHYARTDELSAGGIVLLAGGTALAIAALGVRTRWGPAR